MQLSRLKKAMQPIAYWLAIGGGLGLVRLAPGTVGALLGLPLTWCLAGWSWPVQVGALIPLLIVGAPICAVAARRIGRHDPGCVVIDEYLTVPLVFVFLPTALARDPVVLAVGFGLHRLFDISKPPPVRQLERLPGGWGIMADDVGAALLGLAVMQSLYRLGLFG